MFHPDLAIVYFRYVPKLWIALVICTYLTRYDVFINPSDGIVYAYDYFNDCWFKVVMF